MLDACRVAVSILASEFVVGLDCHSVGVVLSVSGGLNVRYLCGGPSDLAI
jgi:hypothetical protein